MSRIFLTLCLLATLSTAILAFPQLATEEVELPGDDVECGENDTLLPHPDCTKYYVCDNGVPIVLRCAIPLYFNDRTKDCDHQINVPECVGGTRPPTGTSPNTPAPTEQPTEVPTEQPTEVPTEQPTEAPTDAPTEAPTDAPTEAPTDAPTEAPTDAPTEAPTDAPTEAPTDAPTQAPTDAPTQAPTEQPTEAPTDAPTQAPTDAPTEAPTTPEVPLICKEDGIYNLPVPNNCSAYIQCVNHVAIPHVCSEGLLFDPVLLKCNLEELVTCETEPVTTPAPTPICEDAETVYNVPYPGNCSLYYLCAFGTPVVQSCADRLLFDVNVRDCVREEDAQCYAEPTQAPTQAPTEAPTTEPSTTTTKKPLVCRAGEYYNVEFPGDCSKYVFCANGVPVLQSCAPGTEFDPEEAKCVREEDYECPFTPPTEGPPTEEPPTEEPPTEQPPTEETPQPTTDAPVETTAADKFPCPAGVPHVYKAHPDDCNAFYICRNGVFGGIFYCAEDLWFSSALQGCVDPVESDCPAGIRSPSFRI